MSDETVNSYQVRQGKTETTANSDALSWISSSERISSEMSYSLDFLYFITALAHEKRRKSFAMSPPRPSTKGDREFLSCAKSVELFHSFTFT